MSFQSYLDNIDAATGKTPRDALAEAKRNSGGSRSDPIDQLELDGLGARRR